MKRKHELKEVVAVVNNKGGVGKTTTVQNLSAALMLCHKSARVLVIDLDPQGNLSTLCGWNEEGRTVYDAFKDYQPENGKGRIPVYKSENGIYYSPSSPLLQDLDILLFRQLQPSQVLTACFGLPVDDNTGEGLTYVNDSFDYIMIDCPPALSSPTYNAMAAADGMLVPVPMEGLAVAGLASIMVEMTRVQKGINSDLRLKGILPVMVDPRKRITKGYLNNYLPDVYEGNMTKTFIHQCVKVTEAQRLKLDVFQYAPTCRAADDYRQLARELFK